MDTIQSTPNAENTVIIYTSDHGDMAHEHGMWWKSSFYEGSVGIPLIFSWPNHFLQNVTEKAIVSLIDVGPTALDIAGADPIPNVSGKSFAPLLKGEKLDWPNEIFAEYIGLLGDQPACMIRTGPWKLNYYSEFDSCQLFNIDEDPEERRDLANDPRYQEVIKSGLQKIFARWSADNILEKAGQQERARALIGRCGHSHLPHTITPFAPEVDDVNEFDFSQLPQDPR
jgi:choline-sulfatase